MDNRTDSQRLNMNNPNVSQVSAPLTDAQRLDDIKAVIRETSPNIAIPDSLQFYPGYHHKGGVMGDRCVTCHHILGHGSLVVKENGWEHWVCYEKRMEGTK